jgi:hypothetical protein
MQDAVGSRNHKIAAAVVRSADNLWDARGGHDPMVAATTTHQLLLGGRGVTRGPAVPVQKVAPLATKIFLNFQNPGNGVCKYHSY